MQKRTANAVRGMVESDYNPIVSIHDHGAGGHLNCLSELVEETGGLINLDNSRLRSYALAKKLSATNLKKEWVWLLKRRPRYFTEDWQIESVRDVHCG